MGEQMISDRKHQTMYAIEDDQIRVVEAYECNPDLVGGVILNSWAPYIMKWVPSLGWSGCVGTHLFATKKEAVNKLKQELQGTINKAKHRLWELEKSENGDWKKKGNQILNKESEFRNEEVL
jgi:hypothetical protein